MSFSSATLDEPATEEASARCPALALPPEITSEIFLHCLPPVPELGSYPKDAPRSSRAPLLLLRVCRAWRDIAMSTPHLWAHLHLDLGGDMSDSGVGTVINDWFGRARSCPLSFSVRGWAGMHGQEAVDLGVALHRYAPQLESLSLHFLRAHFPRMIELAAKSWALPILGNLAISIPLMYNGIDLRMFTDAPRLRQVSLTNYAAPSMFLLPYDRLSKFTCYRLTQDECLTLVRVAPHLQELTCSVVLDYDDTSVFHHTETVTHHHLRTLRLVANSGIKFLGLLCLPVLETLHLSCDIISIPEEVNFLAFLSHSSASLRRFSTGTQITLLSLTWFSTAMPNLTDLELSAPQRSFVRDFFARLDRVKHRDFLPHLRSLSFVEASFGVNPAAISALSSRCASGEDGEAALESFRLIWPRATHVDPLPEKTVAALAELVEQGMSIHVGPPFEGDSR
ncbi:hypothetical protein C8R46DRAFT_1094246 [Mycena filopes]|nr:hypothetical protein C8R46DRAFT_1094246 [Mycena filopes]